MPNHFLVLIEASHHQSQRNEEVDKSSLSPFAPLSLTLRKSGKAGGEAARVSVKPSSGTLLFKKNTEINERFSKIKARDS